MKIIRQYIIILILGLLSGSTFAQIVQMEATKYNFAPYNDSISDYYPFQNSWIDISFPITIEVFVRDTLNYSVNTHRIKILNKENPLTITLIEDILGGNITSYERWEHGTIYGSKSYELGRGVAYTYVKEWTDYDSIEIWHINIKRQFQIFHGVLKR
jgi:hypothetical protein